MTIIEFPGRMPTPKKPAFKAAKFDLGKAIEHYDDQRDLMIFILRVLHHSPRALKKSLAGMKAASESGEMGYSDFLPRLICDAEQMIGYYQNLTGALQDALSRVVAIERDLRTASPKVARRNRAVQMDGIDVQLVPHLGTVN